MVLTKLKPRNRLSFVRLNSEKVKGEGLAKLNFPDRGHTIFFKEIRITKQGLIPAKYRHINSLHR